MEDSTKESSLSLKQHQELLSKIQTLENAVADLSSKRKNKNSFWLSVKRSIKSFFSRDNLELFLSLTSLAISVCVVIYLVLE